MQKNKIKKKLLSHVDKISIYIIVFSIFGLIINLFIELKPLLNNQMFVKELVLQLVLKIFMWCSIGFSLFYFLLFYGNLIKHSLVFKSDNLREIKQKMKAVKIETKAGKLVIHAQIIVIFWLAFVIMLIYFYMFFELFFFIIFCIVILLWSNFRISNPPTILFLSSSSKSLVLLFNHYDFKCLIRPLRVLSLLEYFSSYNYNNNFNDNEINKIYNELALDIYRTEFDDDWKNTFNILLDLTKIVIIDTDIVTNAVLYEAKQIIKNKMHYKCIFLKNENNDTPLLNCIKNDIIHIKDELCILNFKECFKLLNKIDDEYNFPTSSKTFKEIKMDSNNKGIKTFKSYTADESCKYAIKYLDAGKFEEAEKYFLISLNSTFNMNESIWTNLSIVSINMKKYEKALYQVEKALELNSNHPNALYTKGLVFEKMRDKDNALIYYQKFVEISSDKNTQQFKDTIRRISILKEGSIIENDDTENFLKTITIDHKEKEVGLFSGLFDSNRNIGYCYLCKEEGHFREMMLVEDRVYIDMSKWQKPWNPTQSCYQCANCGRLVCYTHCDDRVPCKCGSQSWVTRSYIQKELDNG